MTHLHRDVTITRPPDEVFASLTDFDQRARWEAGVLAARQSPTGAVRAGTKVFKTRREFGRRVVTTVAVTDYQPERRRLSERVVDGALRGTTVTWSVKPLAPWLIWRTRAELARSLQGLKDALERPAETSVPAMGTDQPAAEGAV